MFPFPRFRSSPVAASVLGWLALFTGTAPSIRAQTYLTQIGSPTFTTSVPVELGAVNVANGNLRLAIPLGSFPQRHGPPLTTIAGVTKTISYAYNLDGSISSLTYPSGRQVTYTVGNAGRLTSAKDVSAGTQYATAASYAPTGALQGLISGQINGGFGGITESHSYNNRLEYTGTQASSSNGTALNLSIGYSLPGGNNGSVSSITNNVDNGRNETLAYDTLNRISSAATQATSGADCWDCFGIDALANLTGMTVTQCAGGSLSTSANGSNQLSGLSYDAAGNTTGDGAFTYTFDAEKGITSAAGVNYTYDGNGLRVEKSSGVLYWRSIFGDAIAETDLNGNTTSEYVFMSGRRVARLDGSGNAFYYFPYPLGTTRTITNAQGQICYDADFTPYGDEIQHTNSCPQNYKFTGFERDTETALDYAFGGETRELGGTRGQESVKKSAFPIPGRKNYAIRSNMSDCSASLSDFPRAEKSDFQFFHTFQTERFLFL